MLDSPYNFFELKRKDYKVVCKACGEHIREIISFSSSHSRRSEYSISLGANVESIAVTATRSLAYHQCEVQKC